MGIFRKLGEPLFLRAFHGWLTIVWAILIPVSVATDLKNSVPWIVAMSVWANFAGHFASWQAARIEVKQDDSDL